ncbi:hypothetical protein L873DRAFT_267286 [Choiromyces venosus 120613-1]|uniref:Uncharacterized protein n=1 Tax=Choiromyces venosus 120613-1 TaxID=1336337 RepID=A0A3N4JD88_9PEZI|nr:hypothetical protein L873DRAFT_267286 [Choiromyces venosus 120613-1]
MPRLSEDICERPAGFLLLITPGTRIKTTYSQYYRFRLRQFKAIYQSTTTIPTSVQPQDHLYNSSHNSLTTSGEYIFTDIFCPTTFSPCISNFSHQ